MLLIEHTRGVGFIRKEADRAIHEAKAHFDRGMALLQDHVTCLTEVDDAHTVTHLTEMAKLHNEISKKTRFSTENNPINHFLIHYHMHRYVGILHSVLYNQCLPLSSEPRMEAAILALQGAKEVLAVNTDTDRWYRHPDRYQEANKSAARTASVKRVFIFAKSTDITTDFDNVLCGQVEAGIVVKVFIQKDKQRVLDSASYDKLQFINLLICDKRIMTRSESREKHDGFLVLNPAEIHKYESRFWDLWAVAEDYAAYRAKAKERNQRQH